MRSRCLQLFCLAFLTGLQPVSAAAIPQVWWANQPLNVSADSAATIDEFIQQKLAFKGLQSSPPASRRDLIRRVTFDLTGLPPSPEEVAQFLSDTSPNAYGRLLDRLLNSPHYGEQWARHWLDLARYSDTKGYVYAREESRYVHSSSYRDWVVSALNQDMGYDRFVLLQLAADQLEAPESAHLAAMGFLTLGRRFLGVTHDIIDDRIDVVTQSLLGLTVACARCHDHKFDPIPTADYYSLYGIFQNSLERLVPAGRGSPDADFNQELSKRQSTLTKTQAQRKHEQEDRVRTRIKDHLLAQFELDRYPEENFGQLLSENDLNPIFVRRWQSLIDRSKQEPSSLFSLWHAYTALPAQDYAKQAAFLKVRSGSALLNKAFATPPASKEEVATRYASILDAVRGQWQEQLKQKPDSTRLEDPDAEQWRQLLYGPESPCLIPAGHIANTELFYPINVVTELWRVQGEVDRWLMESPHAPAYATILEDRRQLGSSRIFLRGSPSNKGAEVPRRFLQAIAGANASPFTQGSGRLELAQAIVNPSNPLTARVLVNRVWMHHFGQGLVRTSSDFGTRTPSPEHLELLDWLALRFMQDGWSLKKLHRLILSSQTYQQSTAGPVAEDLLAKAQIKDPENRLLWRMNPHRLTFEEWRDAWLTASGSLDIRLGGRSLELFHPDNRRRTLYATVDRANLANAFRTFDFANPDLTIPKRTETIVPQQALFGMNHPFVAEQARSLIKRLQQHPAADNTARIVRLYELLFQRPPASHEVQASLDFLNQPEPEPAKERLTAKDWQYGMGTWNESAGRLEGFRRLPHFNGKAWQGGDRWPDVKHGWAQLTAEGGHPGNDRKHAVARRWTAPQEGLYHMHSSLNHEPKAGDGIRAFVGHSVKGQLLAASVHGSEVPLNLTSLTMKAGETIDFVVDIGGGLNSDQFLWAPVITLAGTTGSGGDQEGEQWDAKKDFPAPQVSELSPWEQLAQVLMLSNEFLFVD